MTSRPHHPLRVLIASSLDEAHVRRIEDVDPRVQVLYAPELLPEPRYVADHHGVPRSLDSAQTAAWLDLLGQAQASFDFDWYQPELMAKNAPQLKWVQATSSGIGEFLHSTGLVETDVTFTTAAGVHAIPLSEFVMLGLLYLIKDVPMLRDRMAGHDWQRYTARSLAGRKALVVGMGHVGRSVAEYLDSAGLNVVGASRSPQPPPTSVSQVISLQELSMVLPSIDVLVLCCPLTTATHHLIGAAELAALPQGALVANVARGQVIDEQALIASLLSGHLGGAALDVVETEPLPVSSPLWAMPNVLISPHSASTLSDENDKIVDIFTDNLRRWLDGRQLRNRFTRADSIT